MAAGIIRIPDLGVSESLAERYKDSLNAVPPENRTRVQQDVGHSVTQELTRETASEWCVMRSVVERAPHYQPLEPGRSSSKKTLVHQVVLLS